MMRKKDALARVLRAVCGIRAATTWRSRSVGELLVLAYHRVLPVASEARYPFDIELVSADPEQFDWQMAWLARNFTVLPVSEIADRLQRGRPLPKGSVAVTFDDGFLDNYTHAYPVLRSRRVPACIFLSTGYVGTERNFWFEEIAQLLMSAPARSVRLPSSPDVLPRADDAVTRREDIGRVLSELKRMPDDMRRTRLDEFRLQMNGHATTKPGFSAHAMNWGQVAEMSHSGIEFGSHGVSHAVLSRLSSDDLRRELTESRLAIERATGAPVTAIAYPVGGEDAIGDRVVSAARDAGYRLGFSYLPGSNRVASADYMQLTRQHVERYTGRAYFQALLAFPSLFH
jgi:peptidoglycan/xylan/chitin deacetylase (PgdA/CDA1 family)